jgi:hypothetical protein
MKTSTRYTLIVLGLLILTALSLQSCTQTAEAYAALKTNNIETVNSAISATNATELTDDEIASLVYMREEEKLAHDVYLTLYDLYGLPIFKNIARSEQTHTDAVKRLLDAFDIPDPADTSPIGVFEDVKLQSLYDELIQTGSQSLGDALKVGAAIEEIDILDLEENLDFVENESIRSVFNNLLQGSENHLRAFTKTLARNTGETYQPQYMDADAYNDIVTSSSSTPQRVDQQGDKMTISRGGRNRR